MKKILAGLCLYIMVVMQVTAFGAVLPRNTIAAAPPRRPIIPILECVADLGGGNYSARFGYNNQNNGVETIAIGANNGFNPAPIDRGQPTSFLTGLRSNVFSMTFNGSPLKWTVKGPDNVARSVTASSSSTSCGNPTPTPTPSVTPTPTPEPGSCVPGTFSFGNGQQQTSGSPNVRTTSVNGITLSTRAFARPRAGIAPETNFTPSFVSNQKPGYGVTNPGEGTGGGDLQKIDNADNQRPAQIDYIVQYSSTQVVFDRAVLEKVGADSDVRIWIGNVTALPASVNQAFLDTLYTEYLPDGGGPTRTINFNAGNLAGNLFIIAPSPSGVNDSFNLKSLTYTCPPTGPVNTPPDAVNDSATVAEDSGATNIDVLANDTDADGNPLTITAVTQPAGGTVANNGTNVTFTPATNFAGNTSFTYAISDGQGGSDTATVNVTVTPVNDPPVAIGNSYSTTEDTVLNVAAPGVLGNDMDVDGPSVSAVLVSTTTNGTLALNANGSFSYTPNANFSGTDTFVYQASDGIALSGPATVTITITPVNDPPDAVNDSATVEEDSTNNAINVLANDSDDDGGMLSVTAATNGSNGTVTFTATGVSYTPNANFNGGDSFTYTISDGQGGIDAATVSVTVTPVNDTPDAVDDTASVQENSTNNTINVLANDTDVDGDTLTVSAVSQPANGSVTNNGTNVSYTPNADFTGTDTFTYTISDGNGGTDTAAVTITVTNVNQAPDAVDDSATVAEDSGANAINVLANDTDPDGDALSVTAVTQGANGSVSFTATGVSYIPNANFNGSDSFTYTISDGNGGTDTATVNVTVTAVNDPPVAVDDSGFTTTEDNVLNIPSAALLANDNDGGDGGPLTLQSVSPTSANGGTVVIVGSNVRYAPALNFAGSDTFTYTISDGTDTATATVSLTVTDVPEVAVNLLLNEIEIDPPNPTTFACQYVELRGTQGYTAPAEAKFVSINGIAGNFGDVFLIANLGGVTVGSNGTITIVNDVELCPNRTFPSGTTIISVTNFSGLGEGAKTFAVVSTASALVEGTDIDVDNDRTIDPNFNLMVVDGIAITTNQVLEAAYAPIIYDSATQNPDPGDLDLPDAATRFLGNTTPLSAAAWYYGDLASSPDDSTVYEGTPQSSNFPVGGRLTPGDQNTLFVANQPPDAVDDTAAVAEDSTNNVIDVLANDTDPDGGTLTITAVTNGANGTVINNGTNVSYTPHANFNGTDTFTYTISDGQGGSDTATVTVTVGGVNDAPDAVDDSASVAENSTNNIINVLANDTDGDGDSLTITTATNGANGTVVNNGTNVSYTPNLNFEGIDTFTYTISDGNGGSDTATVTVTVVGGANQAPNAVDDAATVAEDSGASPINVLANDSDPDGDPLSVTAATNGANGSVTFTATGVSYTPNANFNGSDSFTYTISDGALTDTATVTVTVTAVNDAPDAVDDSASVAEDSTNNIINVLANDTDIDAGQTLTITTATNGSNGTVVNNGTNVAYTPNANFTGSDSFTYTISDGNGGSDTATVNVTVGGTNDAPDAVNDAATVAEDSGANAINVLANDTDPDGDSLSVTAATQGTNGSVTFAATSVSYTPNANFTGSDSFNYTISDGNGGTDSATVAVTVTGVNDAPDAVNDSATVAEDSGANAINVLANDTDPEGNTLSVTAITQGANGSVTFTAMGVSYTPNANFNGSDSFTYTISDGNGGSDTATVGVTVTAVNDAPDAVNDSATVAEDTTNNTISVLANDTDIDAGQTRSITAVTQGTNGSVVNNGANVSYTPAPNFFGTDTFTYTISDGNGGTDTATVTVTVTDVPDIVVDLLVNEVEADAPDAATQFPCQYVELRGAPGYVVPGGAYFASINGASGSFGDLQFLVSLEGVTVGPNGTITIINQLEGTCPGRTFPADTTLIAIDDFDGLGLQDSGARTFAIFTSPTAPPTDIDTNNDRVIDPALGITIVDGFGFTTNVTFQTTYAPNLYDSASQAGNTLLPDAATRFIADTTPMTAAAWYFGELASTPPSTTVYSGAPQSTNFPTGGRLTPGASNTLTPVNQPPDAVNDSATVAEDSGANAINVLVNDTDPNGDTLTVTAVTQGTAGSVTFTATGVTYTPNADFSGADSFTYTISDGNGGTDTATAAVTVTPVNDAPVANPDAATVDEDTTNNAINVLANDNDGGDGGPLSVTAVTQPANGAVTFAAGGVSYTPTANFLGTDTFTYTVSDGGATAVGTVTVTVNDVPEGPTVELIVNEVEADAPDPSLQFSCQYVELRGAPGYVVPAEAYFVSINGASGSFGDLQFIVPLGGITVGSNGTITIVNDLEGPCANRTFPAGTTMIAIQDFDGLGLQDSGARTFAIITAPTAPQPGDDIDTNNDRVIDPANGVAVVDGFGFTTNVLFQTTYAPNLYDAASVAANTLLPDAATRFSTNTTPMSAAAWYFGELASSPADTTVYSGTPRTTPFPAGGALTPGDQNVP